MRSLGLRGRRLGLRLVRGMRGLLLLPSVGGDSLVREKRGREGGGVRGIKHQSNVYS